MSFWMAWKMILGNKERTFFPFMGIVLGLSAMVAIFSLGEGGKESVKNDLSAIASNRLIIGGDITIADLEAVENLPVVEYGFLPGANIDTYEINLQGYSNKALYAIGQSAMGGMDILINPEEWPGAGMGDRIDVTLGSRRETFVVKGFYGGQYASRDLKDFSISGKSGIISLTTLRRLAGRTNYERLVVTLPEDEDSSEMSHVILSTLRRYSRKGKNYFVMETSSRYDRVVKIKRTINLFLGAICTVALIMGGLGISNLMAAMVRERTEHIGILRAFGMKKDSVMEIFVYEAMIISGCGGILGSLLGMVISKVVGILINVPPIFMGTHFIMIICISLLMGLVFGILPAKRAADMEPIDAIRG